MHFFTDFLRIVSCPAWDDGKSSWQEISRLRFAALEMTGEGKTIVYHCGRKLFANGFLLDVGNGDSCRQETIRQEISRLRFAPLEMTGEGETIVYHGGGKLVEKVSYPAWDDGKSSRQETVCV